MREIKFRAWIDTEDIRKDINGKRVPFMTKEVDTIDFNNGELYFGKCFVCKLKECILMQYIGKGKNNVDVYDKDIVKTPLGKIVEIGWENDTNEFRWEDKQYYSACGKKTELEELEVVGNKLENPELLEELA